MKFRVIEVTYGNGNPNWRAREERGEDVQMSSRRVAAFETRDQADNDAAQRQETSGPGYAFFVM